MKPLVSIIMPVYNVELYLSKSIESVLAQTYRRFELIIVDDGSPDNSIEIATRYSNIDSRIKIVRKNNGGLSDARNVGMKYANGKYIFFLDSDDYIENNLLEKTVDCAEKNGSDVVIFGYFVDYVDKNENIKYTKDMFVEFSKNELDEKNYKKVEDTLLPMLGYAWNKLYNREYLIINNYSFEKGVSLIEDILFNKCTLSNTKNITILSEQFYHYIQRERVTLASTFYENSYELKLKSIDAREHILKSWNIDENLIKSTIAKQQLNTIRFCSSNMFYYNNNLNLINKYKYIDYIVNDEKTKHRIKDLKTNSISELIIKNVIRYRLSSLIWIVYYINSKKYLNNKNSI